MKPARTFAHFAVELSEVFFNTLIHCANYLSDHKKKLFSHCYREG